jgi:HK97 gp10 family phage protein
MAVRVKVEGLRDLDRALAELPRATGKNVLRRVGRSALEPLAAAMAGRAPVDEGHLKASIGVGTKLTLSQASLHRKMFRSDKASVELFAGAGGLAQAITQEFGTVDHVAQPFARPAWDAGKGQVLEHIKSELGNEIAKAAQRLARKAARLAAKG